MEKTLRPDKIYKNVAKAVVILFVVLLVFAVIKPTWIKEKSPRIVKGSVYDFLDFVDSSKEAISERISNPETMQSSISPSPSGTTQPSISISPPEETPIPILEIINPVLTATAPGHGVIEARIKNNGEYTYTNVKVQGIFFDRVGSIVEIKSSYPVGDLKPGEEKTFKIYSEKLLEYLDDFKLIPNTGSIQPPPLTQEDYEVHTQVTPQPEEEPPQKGSFTDRIKAFLERTKEEIEIREREGSIAALSYVNVLRADHDRSVLEWSDALYDLALFRARDLDERGYFDHVTPEGKCVNDFASQFDVHSSVAENLGMGYYTKKGSIDGWMDSRGHRYNLLYPQHTLGAIAKHGNIYVFLGTGPMESGWQCATGDAGNAFWRIAEKQPGEE